MLKDVKQALSAAILAMLSMAVAPAAFAAPSELAITVDDLPSAPEVIQTIVSAMQAKSVPEVYGFFNGATVGGGEEASPQLEATRAWIAAGYPLGNHTFSHLDINRVSTETYLQDIVANEIPLRDFSQGMHFHLFRYPYLHEGGTREKRDAVRAFLRSKGYAVAPVSLDFQDWAWTEADMRCRRTGDREGHFRNKFVYIVH